MPKDIVGYTRETGPTLVNVLSLGSLRSNPFTHKRRLRELLVTNLQKTITTVSLRWGLVDGKKVSEVRTGEETVRSGKEWTSSLSGPPSASSTHLVYVNGSVFLLCWTELVTGEIRWVGRTRRDDPVTPNGHPTH